MDERILATYNSPEGADEYAIKFEKHWNERLNNVREQWLLRGLLKALPSGKLKGVALDMPCGYGRLFEILSERVERVVEGDWGFDMVRSARRNQVGRPALGYVRGTALQFPFRDRAFAVVLSVRLCHHIRDHGERRTYVRELFRIADQFVVFTYFDAATLKNRIRELQRRFRPKRQKWTLTFDEVQAIAAEAGFEIVKTRLLSALFSGHRYVIARRIGAGR